MNSTKRFIDRPEIGGAIFYTICIILGITMWELTSHINALPYVAGAADDPTALIKAQDAYSAVTNLLITLASGMLAGLGFYLTHKPKQSYSRPQFWFAALSALFGCVSLYWGYISSQNVQWAIESSIPTLGLEKIQLPRQLQVVSILIGVFCFAEFVRRDLTQEA
jgi:hypothetical protein